jgi:hypothetical protein
VIERGPIERRRRRAGRAAHRPESVPARTFRSSGFERAPAASPCREKRASLHERGVRLVVIHEPALPGRLRVAPSAMRTPGVGQAADHFAQGVRRRHLRKGKPCASHRGSHALVPDAPSPSSVFQRTGRSVSARAYRDR